MENPCSDSVNSCAQQSETLDESVVSPVHPQFNPLPLEWLLGTKAQDSFADRVLARLIQSEAHEVNPHLKDDYRQSFITISLALKGDPQPFVSASYRMYGIHPEKLWPAIVARRKALLGSAEEFSQKKSVQSVKVESLAGKLASGGGTREMPSKTPGCRAELSSSWRREVTPDKTSGSVRIPALVIAVVLAWIALTIQVRCQELPQAPEPRKTPVSFWALTGAYSLGIIGDDLSTQRYERMGCVEVWNPSLYGRRPSNARFLAVSFGLEAAYVIPARKMVRAKSRLWKSLGYGLLTWQAEGRADAIIHNLNLTRKECQ